MYRKSAYNKSQETLLQFASMLNSVEEYPNLYCCPIIAETMLNDGCFVDVGAGKLFAFDWEIRRNLKSFKPGDFRYSTLTEFERKFDSKKNTQLFIQCDSMEQYIAVAWREDFMKSAVTSKNVACDDGFQNTNFLETDQFKIYAISNIVEFKEMLYRAFQSLTFNHDAF